MPRRKPHFRIAVVSPVRSDSSYGSFLGVMDYKERSAHWQLVGQPHNPIAGLDEIDLSAVDGVIGFIRERRWADIVTRAGVAAVNFSNALAELPVPRVGHDDVAMTSRLGAWEQRTSSNVASQTSLFWVPVGCGTRTAGSRVFKA